MHARAAVVEVACARHRLLDDEGDARLLRRAHGSGLQGSFIQGVGPQQKQALAAGESVRHRGRVGVIDQYRFDAARTCGLRFGGRIERRPGRRTRHSQLRQDFTSYGAPAPVTQIVAYSSSSGAAHTALGRSAGASATELRDAQAGVSADARTQAALHFVLKLVDKRGQIEAADVQALRTAGFGDAEIVEILAHVALSLFTNYVNVALAVPEDFPGVKLREAA